MRSPDLIRDGKIGAFIGGFTALAKEHKITITISFKQDGVTIRMAGENFVGKDLLDAYENFKARMKQGGKS